MIRINLERLLINTELTPEQAALNEWQNRLYKESQLLDNSTTFEFEQLQPSIVIVYGDSVFN